MRKWISAVALFLAWVPAALMADTSSLLSLRAVHALSNTQAAQHLPAEFEATVTYFRPYEKTLFVQDGGVAIYVQATTTLKLIPGDRIVVRGTTHESFRPFVLSNDITLLHHGTPPKALPASFDDLIHARMDCLETTVRARVLAADITLSSDIAGGTMQLLMDGGGIEAIVDSDDAKAISGLLDAEVEITGVVSGQFDGKMQMTGILFHIPSLAEVRVIKRPGASPWSLPVTPMDEIISGLRVNNFTQRIRVQGTITYYQPGSAAVLQNGTKSLWINTQGRGELQIGDVADATGFPDVHDGFLTMTKGEIQDRHVQAPVNPLPVDWRELTLSHHVFDLVSIEGQVVAEVREAGQDRYDLESGGHLFSAIVRHPPQIISAPAPQMKEIPRGSTVRVTGVCILEDSNPFNSEVPFDLLMRSYDDIAVVARPSWLSVGNLVRLVSLLMVIVLAVSAWGWMLNRKVQRQTAALAKRIEAEAALERLSAQREQQRSKILEDINGSRPLAEILEEITTMLSFHENGAPCWCEITDGARLGQYPADLTGLRIIREEIPARSGPPLGVLLAGLDAQTPPGTREREPFVVASRLATLAIETRRLYSDLVHRSEFDLLTDIHNRFSLDKQLEEQIVHARERAGIFGLIYVDLDEFKLVNDRYGHHVGDLYLQEVCLRMKRQLRSGDLLARLGGDEFAVLVQAAHNRTDVQEIALRLEHCFKEPFTVDNYELEGSASVGIALYPDDGATKDSLLSAADSAMYMSKFTKRQAAEQTASGRVLTDRS